MNATIPRPAPPGDRTLSGEPPGTCAVEIVVPVYNEEADLGPSVARLHAYLHVERFPSRFRITIADNASTDGTWAIAAAARRQLPRGVHAVHLDRQGPRPRAARGVGRQRRDRRRLHGRRPVDRPGRAAAAGRAAAVRPLRPRHRQPPGRGSAGSCAAPSASSSRAATTCCCARRCARGSPTPSAASRRCAPTCARRLLPLVEDTGWFFDTELLVLAERAGLRIHEVPVDWVDDPDSRVDIVTTASTTCAASRGSAARSPPARCRSASCARQLGREPLRRPSPGVPPTLLGQLVPLRGDRRRQHARLPRCSTSLCRGTLGAQGANFARAAVTAVANTAANRRLTFGVRGRAARRAHQLQGLVVFALGLGADQRRAGAARARVDPHPARSAELAVLVAANARPPLLRFVLFRAWVFHPRRNRPARPARHRRRRPPMSATLHAPPSPAPPTRPAAAGRPSAARSRTPLGRASARSPCWSAPPCSTCGASAPPATPTTSTPRPRRPARRAGRRSSSARSTPSNSITVDKPPAVAVGDGPVGPALRLHELEHARAAGARGRRPRSALLYADGAARGRRRGAACVAGACSR